MKKLLLVAFSLLMFSCSSDDATETQEQCGMEMRIKAYVTFANGSPHVVSMDETFYYDDKDSAPLNFTLIEQEFEINRMDCGETDLDVLHESFDNGQATRTVEIHRRTF